MFKKLQRKFIWGSALVLLLVIAAVSGVVYWITSGVISRQTEVITDMILDNGGDLPERIEFDSSHERFLALSGESLYETRFLTAVKKDGDVDVTVKRIAMLSEGEIDALIEKAYESRKESGRIGVASRNDYIFSKRTGEDGTVLLVVLDASSRYAMQRLTMTYMTGLWLIVLILYIIVILRYSKKLIRPFVENDERQKRFITNASHELKTPLAVISANTEMTEAVGGKTKWTESTRRQIARLQTLIEDLVVLTRADELKEENFTEVDFSALVSETSEPFRSVAESAGKTYNTEVAPGLRVNGDKRSLSHVVSVLIDNAVKYCDGQGVVSVKLESTSRKKGAKLTVSNTYAEGKTVDVSRFFERFYRQDESHNS